MSEQELIRLLERIRAIAKGHMEYFAGEIFSDADAALRILRALIPPAAAPAAECSTSPGHWCVDLACPRHGAAPAADTCPLYCGATPAAPGSHHMNDCGLYAYPGAETEGALLRECDDVLARVQGHGCPPSDESIAALRTKLRARPAPVAETGKAPTPSLRKECGDNSPEWWTGRWRDWHRGHGCGKDDGQPCTPEGIAEFAAHGRLPGRAAQTEREGT